MRFSRRVYSICCGINPTRCFLSCQVAFLSLFSRRDQPIFDVIGGPYVGILRWLHLMLPHACAAAAWIADKILAHRRKTAARGPLGEAVALSERLHTLFVDEPVSSALSFAPDKSNMANGLLRTRRLQFVDNGVGALPPHRRMNVVILEGRPARPVSGVDRHDLFGLRDWDHG